MRTLSWRWSTELERAVFSPPEAELIISFRNSAWVARVQRLKPGKWDSNGALPPATRFKVIAGWSESGMTPRYFRSVSTAMGHVRGIIGEILAREFAGVEAR